MKKICLWKRWCKQHIEKKLTMIIQNRVEDKIREVGKWVERKLNQSIIF
jgi:hypothetical protein